MHGGCGWTEHAGSDHLCLARGTRLAGFPGWFGVESAIRSPRQVSVKGEGSSGTTVPCKSAHFALRFLLGMWKPVGILVSINYRFISAFFRDLLGSGGQNPSVYPAKCTIFSSRVILTV